MQNLFQTFFFNLFVCMGLILLDLIIMWIGEKVFKQPQAPEIGVGHPPLFSILAILGIVGNCLFLVVGFVIEIVKFTFFT